MIVRWESTIHRTLEVPKNYSIIHTHTPTHILYEFNFYSIIKPYIIYAFFFFKT